MANAEYLSLLLRGSVAWNDWRRSDLGIKVADLRRADLTRADLHGADLSGADLREVDLRRANLSRTHLSTAYFTKSDLYGADLTRADLREANLSMADLHRADLREADLRGADLYGADLYEANLSGADLTRANLHRTDLTRADLREVDLRRSALHRADLREADLSGADLSWARLYGTVFENVDLTKAIGLDECTHMGPSIIDFSTLSRSANLPISFLRGCGLSDRLIEYIPSLRDEAIQFYSCFISYSSKDHKFAERLHADLQNAGVRCWFAPHDLPTGAKNWDAIDEAIRLRDKLLVILSKASIDSEWVEDEVNKAYAEERDRKAIVLFPVRIDDAVMTTQEPWARRLRDQRNIGDFRQWRRIERYSKSLELLLRDLKATTGTGAT